jgi:hypothetical protein
VLLTTKQAHRLPLVPLRSREFCMFDFFRTKEKNKNDQTALATALGLDPSLFEDIPDIGEGESELGSSIRNLTSTTANTKVEEMELLKELEKLQLNSRQSQNDGNIMDQFGQSAESLPSKSIPRHSQKTMNTSLNTESISRGSTNGADKVPRLLDTRPIYELLKEVPTEPNELLDHEFDKDPELLRQFESILTEMKVNGSEDQPGPISTEIPIHNNSVSSLGEPSTTLVRQIAPMELSQVLKDVPQTTNSTTMGSSPLDGSANREDTTIEVKAIPDVTSTTLGNILDEFRKRKNEYVKLALEYKRSGNIGEAKKSYAIAKGMDSSIKLLEMGKPVGWGHLPPKPNPMDTKKTNVPVETGFSKPIPETLHPVPGMSSTDSMTFEKMEMLIKAQIIECDQICRYYLLENRREDALKFRKLAEFLKQDLEILLQAQSKHQELPGFSYVPIHLSYKKTLSDIAANELVIQIPRAIGLQSTNETGPLNTFLTCDLPYPMETGTKFQSVVVPSSDPAYNVTRKIPIQRNRTLQRVLEKKKLTITISNSIRLFSFIPMGSMIYGHVSIDLQSLLTHCDIHEFAEVRETWSFPLFSHQPHPSLVVSIRSYHRFSILENGQPVLSLK